MKLNWNAMNAFGCGYWLRFFGGGFVGWSLSSAALGLWQAYHWAILIIGVFLFVEGMWHAKESE